MQIETDLNSLQISEAYAESPRRWKKHLWICLPFFTALVLSLAVISNYLQRRAVISHFKQEMNYVIKSLNQFGWDVAYDNIGFNALYPSNLIAFENFKLYSHTQNRALIIEKLLLTAGFFSPSELQISTEGAVNLSFDGTVHKIESGDNDAAIDFKDGKEPNSLTLRIQNLSISDWAEINEINFAARIIAPQRINEQAPFIKTHFDVRNIKLNGLLNYPLGQNIERIYANADVIGQIKADTDFQQAVHEWLSHGGHIAIKEFNLNWTPLLMVGKGELSFNEKFQPVLQLNTSSKALPELIDDLEKKNWFDSKGIFVAKILLNNKAYKADEADRHLTVTTPIGIRDDALLIEKIAVKKL